MDVPTVTIDEIPAGAHLVDVREDDEWAAGHGELPADEELYLICRSGGRSARATAWLNQSGYTAVNVAGGMGEWQQRGLPLVGEGDDPHVI